MDNPEYPRVADDDNDARDQEGGDKHRSLAASPVLVIENRASLQFRVVAEFACGSRATVSDDL